MLTLNALLSTSRSPGWLTLAATVYASVLACDGDKGEPAGTDGGTSGTGTVTSASATGGTSSSGTGGTSAGLGGNSAGAGGEGGAPSDAAFGCYDMATHQCDCEADEAACSEGDGIWTEQCACDPTAPNKRL